jgi:hypothetical protein
VTDTFPFSPERLAALSALSAEINGTHAPPPIAAGVIVEDGWVSLPVPDHRVSVLDAILSPPAERLIVRAQLHAGLTLQWAPLPGGSVVEFRGGSPDGKPDRDACACFLTAKGLRGLAADLNAIADAIGGAE